MVTVLLGYIQTNLYHKKHISINGDINDHDYLQTVKNQALPKLNETSFHFLSVEFEHTILMKYCWVLSILLNLLRFLSR